MTSVIKPIFMRPIEITSSNSAFSVVLDDGGSTTYDIELESGVWGSIINVAAGIAEAIEDTATNWSCTSELVESGNTVHIKFTLTDALESGTAPQYEWNEIYDIIGSASADSGNYDTDVTVGSGVYTVEMTYAPQFTWVPIYQTAEQGRFYKRQQDIFRGNMAMSGAIGGNIAGPDIYWRDMTFVNETAENLYVEAATSTRMTTRNLEYFADKCRSSYPETAGNPSTKGFYFFPDWNDAIDTCTEFTEDAGGIQFDYSSDPDTHAFCQMDIKGPGAYSPYLPTTRTRYSTGFTFHTVAYVPSWEYDYSGAERVV